MNTRHGDCSIHPTHTESLWSEIACHMPYGIFSVALSFIVLGFLQSFFTTGISPTTGYILFHNFHFLHIIFATTGAYLALIRMTDHFFFSMIMSFVSSTIFCTLSDIILPHIAGLFFGVNMHLHLCIVSELHNILIFWAIGFMNALVIARNNSLSNITFTSMSHFGHFFTSSLASLFYLVAEGFTTWYAHMGMLFVLLMIAVVVPCTFSDVIFPVACRKIGRRHEKHPS